MMPPCARRSTARNGATRTSSGVHRLAARATATNQTPTALASAGLRMVPPTLKMSPVRQVGMNQLCTTHPCQGLLGVGSANIVTRDVQAAAMWPARENATHVTGSCANDGEQLQHCVFFNTHDNHVFPIGSGSVKVVGCGPARDGVWLAVAARGIAERRYRLL